MRESPANSLPGALNPGFGGPGPAILAVLKYLYIFSVLCLHYSMRDVKICIMKSSPKLSNTSKMPSKSWSLPAWETCLGARITDYDTNKPDVAPACKGCYALTGAYMFPNTIKAREHNAEDWKNDDWVDAMVKAIGKAKYFRWFDSGDVYAVELAEKIRLVIKATPNCLHWLPTRAHKDNGILSVYRRMTTKTWTMKCSTGKPKIKPNMDYLPNAIIRYSSDSVNGQRLSNKMGLNSVIIQSPKMILYLRRDIHYVARLSVAENVAIVARVGLIR